MTYCEKDAIVLGAVGAFVSVSLCLILPAFWLLEIPKSDADAGKGWLAYFAHVASGQLGVTLLFSVPGVLLATPVVLVFTRYFTGGLWSALAIGAVAGSVVGFFLIVLLISLLNVAILGYVPSLSGYQYVALPGAVAGMSYAYPAWRLCVTPRLTAASGGQS